MPGFLPSFPSTVNLLHGAASISTSYSRRFYPRAPGFSIHFFIRLQVCFFIGIRAAQIGTRVGILPISAQLLQVASSRAFRSISKRKSGL